MNQNRRKFCHDICKLSVGVSSVLQLTGCDNASYLGNLLLNWNLNMWEKKFKKYAPPALSVDKLGWEEFLNIWSKEATELERAWVFKHGLGGYSKDDIKEIEKTLLVSVPDELYLGGLTYPGRTLQEKDKIVLVIRRAEDIVEASANYAKKQNFLMDNPILYRNYPYIEWKAFSYSALLNHQIQPPANEDEIDKVERSLGMRLPPSYKEFLAASNGYWINSLTCLLPVQHIDLVSKLQPDALYYDGPEEASTAYSHYYKYNRLGRTDFNDSNLMAIGSKLFSQALLLSEPAYTDGQDVDIGIVPYAQEYKTSISPDGEWEAFLSFSLRAKSFKHMMEYLYQESIVRGRDSFENGPFS